MKRILIVLFTMSIYYLTICFISGTFNLILLNVLAKFFIAIIGIIMLMGITGLVAQDKSLDPVPREKKVKGIKKYIGELHEELKLYGEAMELQRKINEFKRNK